MTAGRAVRGSGRLVGPRLVGLVLAGLVLIAGCGGSGAGSPSAPASSLAPATPAPAPPGVAAAAFAPCDGAYQCATIAVPLDYANPTGPTLPLALVRVPARDQAHKLGVLLVNPGGPGGSGIDTVESGAVPAAIADRFDVIGFDPRGVGRSLGLSCPVTPDTPYLADPDPADPADTAATGATVARYVASCGDRYRDLLPHLGTRDVARDMDRIRESLGEVQISYLGFSYGTSIGQTYGELFPARVRAMLLDGVVDLTLPGLDTSQAESFENSLRQFAAACTTDPSCPVRPDAVAVLDRVHARVATTPLPVAGSSPLSAGLLEIGVVTALYSKSTWPVLGRALASADAGDGGPMRRLADEYFSGSDTDAYNAVSCLDSSWSRDAAQVDDVARSLEARAPHFPGNVLVSGLTCADWPVAAQPLTPPTGAGLPPVLVVGTTNDPATPYRNSVALAARLPGAGLLTYQGDGHTIVGQGVPCVDDAAARYLVDRVLPAPGTTCAS